MPAAGRGCRLQQTSSFSRLLTQLRNFANEQQDPFARQFVQRMERNLCRSVTGTATTSRPVLSEQERFQLDNAERALRSVGRLLAAGTDFIFQDSSNKATCMQDFQTLLGPFFCESEFPANGGRQFIARVLSCMLGEEVTLMDIAHWFPNPFNQKLVVSTELRVKLLQRGMSWPPGVLEMDMCQSYLPQSPRTAMTLSRGTSQGSDNSAPSVLDAQTNNIDMEDISAWLSDGPDAAMTDAATHEAAALWLAPDEPDRSAD